jgi:predicted nucleotide-binding protein
VAVLIVEDDAFYSERLSELFADRGTSVITANSTERALSVPSSDYDSALIDIMLPNSPEASGISLEESRGGFQSGVALARKMRAARPNLKIALITSGYDNSEVVAWAAEQDVPLLKKSDTRHAFVAGLHRAGLLNGSVKPRAFIVHGHDEAALLQLKNYLQNVLGWDEPIILREKPNSGKTIIEKFEEFAERIDQVFVIMTPDDKTFISTGQDSRRSRQNVIFELGFFFAVFGRTSGRVIVLYKGPNELPSDISGVCWIDISNGVESAGEQIRREIPSTHS